MFRTHTRFASAAVFVALAAFATLANAKDGKSGIQATVVQVVEPGSYEIEKGNEFTLPFSIVSGIGGDPDDFQVMIDGDEDAVTSEQNFIVQPVKRLIGATNVIAAFKAKKEGKVTITLKVKGKDKKDTFEIKVIPKEKSSK